MPLLPKFRAAVSRRLSGPQAVLIRTILWLPAMIYTFIVWIRNRLYNAGRLKQHRLEAPVVCIGNITAGGTGKTPMVAWLCRYLTEHHQRVAILSRGYKAHGSADNDETQLLRGELPDVPIVVDPDRVRGGRKAIREYHPDIIVLDDGFQHRRLHRDLDIVLIDCTCPFGFGAVLPRGLLREPITGLRRADVIVLTRTDQIPSSELACLHNHIRFLLDSEGMKDKVIVHAQHRAVRLVGSDGKETDLASLQGRKVHAFCGIGNPNAFFDTLGRLGADGVSQTVFPDHTAYQKSDLERLLHTGKDTLAEWFVTTEKDWTKIRQFSTMLPLETVYYLCIRMEITQHRDRLCEAVDRIRKGEAHGDKTN